MNRARCLALTFALHCPAVAAALPQAPTPAAQYQALVREYEQATSGAVVALGDAERRAAAQRVDGLPARFLELAEQNPDDPIAPEALGRVVWTEGNTSHVAGGADSPGCRALALLQRDHVASDRLGLCCVLVCGTARPQAEAFLRAVLAANPHADVRGLACLSLAGYLQSRRNRLEMLQDQPDNTRRWADVFDEKVAAELRRQDAAAARAEIEAAYERAAADYGNVPHPWGGTVGEHARAALNELRHLSVGMTAPPTAGEDQQGVAFALDDYRGKVVLLDFWSQG